MKAETKKTLSEKESNKKILCLENKLMKIERRLRSITFDSSEFEFSRVREHHQEIYAQILELDSRFFTKKEK